MENAESAYQLYVIELRLFTQAQTNDLLVLSFFLSLCLFLFSARETFLFHDSIVSSRTIIFLMWWLFVNPSTIGCFVAASDFFLKLVRFYQFSWNGMCLNWRLQFTPYCLYHFIVIIILVSIVKNGSHSWMEPDAAATTAAAWIGTRSMSPMQYFLVCVCLQTLNSKYNVMPWSHKRTLFSFHFKIKCWG